MKTYKIHTRCPSCGHIINVKIPKGKKEGGQTYECKYCLFVGMVLELTLELESRKNTILMNKLMSKLLLKYNLDDQAILGLKNIKKKKRLY